MSGPRALSFLVLVAAMVGALKLLINDGVPAAASTGADFEAWLRQELPKIPKRGEFALPYVLSRLGCGSDGLVMEFGVFTGATINQMAGACPQRKVYGFDSFAGLPEDWTVDDGKKTGRNFQITRGLFSLKGSLPAVQPNVALVKGWFNETVPEFLARPEVASVPVVSLLHVDSDLYSSAHLVLEALDSRLKPGSVIVFDELVNYPEYRQGELKALFDWASAHKRQFDWLGVSGKVTLDGMNPEGEGPFCSVAIRVTA